MTDKKNVFKELWVVLRFFNIAQELKTTSYQKSFFVVNDSLHSERLDGWLVEGNMCCRYDLRKKEWRKSADCLLVFEFMK